MSGPLRTRIVIPARNEEQSIGRVLDEIELKFLHSVPDPVAPPATAKEPL